MGGATYSSNPDAWRKATQKYCGLEAKVTDPSTGKTKLMYIGDAFDDKWVRVSYHSELYSKLGTLSKTQQTPQSIDIMIDAFTAIHGNPNGNKNIVINGVKWEFTGNINTKYIAPGANWPKVDNPTNPTDPTDPTNPCAGCLGAKCDGKTTVCNDGLTCLSPTGICSDKACNWG